MIGTIIILIWSISFVLDAILMVITENLTIDDKIECVIVFAPVIFMMFVLFGLIKFCSKVKELHLILENKQ